MTRSELRPHDSPQRIKSVHIAKKKNGMRCEVCGWSPPDVVRNGCNPMQAHHIIPVCAGGDPGIENIIVLCPNCHSVAHACFPYLRRIKQYCGPKTKEEIIEALKDPKAYNEKELSKFATRLLTYGDY